MIRYRVDLVVHQQQRKSGRLVVSDLRYFRDLSNNVPSETDPLYSWGPKDHELHFQTDSQSVPEPVFALYPLQHDILWQPIERSDFIVTF